MTQQTFSVGSKPRVVISQLEGNLTVQTWKEQSISVEMNESATELHQEGDTLIINGGKTDLTLVVPAITRFGTSITTDISVTNLTGNVTIEGVGQVELKEISGNVTLNNIAGDVELESIHVGAEVSKIGGDLHASNIPTLLAKKGIGGDASVSDVARVETDATGGGLALTRVETAVIGAVGGDLDVEDVQATLRCNTVGGNCRVQGSASAEVTLNNVGGNLELESAVLVQVSNVGGNLSAQANFPAESRTRVHVGGNASMVVPENANLSLHAIVAGQVSGEALGSRRAGNFANLVYGDGTARLDLIVGGNLQLLGASTPRSGNSSESWNDFGQSMAEMGREMGRLGREIGREFAGAFREADWSQGYHGHKHHHEHRHHHEHEVHDTPPTHAQERAAILRMIAEGRITPEEGDMLLSGLKR